MAAKTASASRLTGSCGGWRPRYLEIASARPWVVASERPVGNDVFWPIVFGASSFALSPNDQGVTAWSAALFRDGGPFDSLRSSPSRQAVTSTIVAATLCRVYLQT
jgi:hypothetical protein